MKIIVIGSQGFIGSHAFAHFSGTHDVWGADIVDNRQQKQFLLLDREHTEFKKIFGTQTFDVCINASGNGNVGKSIEDPLLDYELNVFNTIKMLEAIRLYNPTCRFINFSSAAVYGNPEMLPIRETNTLNPISPYGWHKLFTEKICAEYHALHGIRSVSLRIFSVFGEHLRKQLFWDIYQKTLVSKNIQLFGTGNETRDFIYIRDFTTVLSRVIDNASFAAEAINVACGTETTIREAAMLFCDALDPSISVAFNNQQKQGDPLKWRADITLLRNLGFAPSYTFAQGIKNVAQWISAEKK